MKTQKLEQKKKIKLKNFKTFEIYQLATLSKLLEFFVCLSDVIYMKLSLFEMTFINFGRANEAKAFQIHLNHRHYCFVSFVFVFIILTSIVMYAK